MFEQEGTKSKMKQSKMKSERMKQRAKEDAGDKEGDRTAAEELVGTSDESPTRTGMHEKTGSSIS
jgi:hypothetical protein